ncbi:two-pore potassium channel 3-like isoform X2 [Tripterygium wilfordii]|uniref:two-pore potassium channel 3-like isoform X2 n=1 Tax=Tripterygium wilfordii TaxID=458696 RepID=UPI0018F8503D|nr:two-pore potassium channel 3-like isoform X2 [Tripterygium wilfordii]
MDELFLSKSTGFEAESSRPSPRREFPPGYLDFITNDAIIPIITTPKSSASFVNLIGNLSKNRKGTLTRRSHSAPSVFTDIKQEAFSDDLDQRAPPKSTPWIVRQAFVVVILYIIAGIVFYLTSGSFKGTTTFKPVDAAYFSVVTLCTIGYGDIVPDTTFTKLFTCAFILVGFGFIDILLNGLVTYICDRQEAVLLSTVDENRFNTMMQTYMIDKAKGRMRIRMKVGLALAVVIGCIAVGYGDYAFTTLTGRCFAIIWLLVSTLAVARAFLYLAELRSDRRNRRIAQWVLQKKMTLGDLVAADLDNDGCISKSEFVIFKLREMGKIAEKDILEICKQFDSIDNSNHGKITLADLMGSA